MAVFNPEEVYRLTSSGLHVPLVALHCREMNGGLEYYDLGRQRMIGNITNTDHDEDSGKIVVTDNNGILATFVPISLAVYNSDVKNELTGKPRFTSRSKMVKFLNGVSYW